MLEITVIPDITETLTEDKGSFIRYEISDVGSINTSCFLKTLVFENPTFVQIFSQTTV